MKNNNLYQQTRSPFEGIRKYNPATKAEYWLARDLMKILGYDNWKNFKYVIGKAWHCCNKALQHMADYDRSLSYQTSDLHFFPLLSEKLPKGANVRAERAFENDYKLSRYACYLVAMNASPRYKGVAEIQNYFALTSRIFQEVDRITPILSLPSPSAHLEILYGDILIDSEKIAQLLGLKPEILFDAIASIIKMEGGRNAKINFWRDRRYIPPSGIEAAKGILCFRKSIRDYSFKLTEVGFAKTMVHLRYLFPDLNEKITEVESMISDDFETQKQPFINYVRTVVLPEAQTRKYVYILHNQVTNLYKIGITDNIKRRIMQLTGACGVELQQVFAIKTELANDIEATLHRIFAPYRQEGEWFAIPREEIDAIASEVQFGVNMLPPSRR